MSLWTLALKTWVQRRVVLAGSHDGAAELIRLTSVFRADLRNPKHLLYFGMDQGYKAWIAAKAR